MKKIAFGRTADIYEYGSGKVLKLFHADFPTNRIEMEYQKAMIISNSLKLVPKIYKKVSLDGREGIVYERINGSVMLKSILFNPWKVQYFAKEMAKLHFEVNNKQIKGLESLESKLITEITSVSDLDLVSKDLLIKGLQQMNIKNEGLLHWDFHPMNVLVKNDTYFIIDWIGASSGDPSADIARTVIVLLFSKNEGILKNLDLYAVRKVFVKYYLSETLSLRNISNSEIQKWIPFVAAARLSENLSKPEKNNLLELIDRENARALVDSLF